MNNSTLSLAYEQVIADIKQDAGWNEDMKQEFLDVLKHRIWELNKLLGFDSDNTITPNQITVTNVDEEYLSWSRVIRFNWLPDGSDVPELCVVKIYYSEFEGYDIDWHKSDVSSKFREFADLLTETQFSEMLDNLAYSFQEENK